MDIINKFGTKTSRWLNNTVKSHLTNIFQQGEKNMSDEVVERPAVTKSVPTVVRGTTLDVSSSTSKGKHEEMFEKAQASISRHFRDKNAPSHYDGAFEDLGLIGAAVELVSIASRLKRVVIRSGDGGENFDREKLLELLKDAGVYAGISMICVADENWTGK